MMGKGAMKAFPALELQSLQREGFHQENKQIPNCTTAAQKTAFGENTFQSARSLRCARTWTRSLKEFFISQIG